jgi:hypothetical protein
MSKQFPLFKRADLRSEAGFSEIIDTLQNKIKGLGESEAVKTIKSLPSDLYEKLFGEETAEKPEGEADARPKTKKYYQKILSEEETKRPGKGTIKVTKLQTVPGPPGSDDAFYARVLAGIGAPVTPETKRFMYAWRAAEGGQATFNPFNTTRKSPDKLSTNYNSVGVQNYADEEQGIAATIATLLNGRYGTIIDALKDPRPGAALRAARALAKTPWGTGKLAEKVLLGKQITRRPIYWLPEDETVLS